MTRSQTNNESDVIAINTVIIQLTGAHANDLSMPKKQRRNQ